MFFGISLGSIFVLYAPLEPSIYSLGGILLASSMLLVAKLYHKILTTTYLFKILLAVEMVTLFMISYFLLFSYSYTTALVVYVSYQIIFVFGSYIPRAETLFLKKMRLLSLLDVTKQKGYIFGMFLSYGFYKIMEIFFNISSKETQVYNMHFLLLLTQFVIIYFLLKAFK